MEKFLSTPLADLGISILPAMQTHGTVRDLLSLLTMACEAGDLNWDGSPDYAHAIKRAISEAKRQSRHIALSSLPSPYVIKGGRKRIY